MAEVYKERRAQIQALLSRAEQIEKEADALDPDAIAVLPTANNLRLRAMCIDMNLRVEEERDES